LFTRAAAVNKVGLDFGRSPTESKLSDAAKAHMDDFLENIYLVLPALRFDFFTQNVKPAAAPLQQSSFPGVVWFTFEVPKNGIKARARLEDGSFIVEEGSIARREWMGVEYPYATLHQDLIDQGILKVVGDHCVFGKSYAFSSASAAAAVTAGRPASGPKSWIVEGTNKNYGEWEVQHLAIPSNQEHA
jgi:hypothetical protein